MSSPITEYIQCIQQCNQLLQLNSDPDTILVRLESLLFAVEQGQDINSNQALQNLVSLLRQSIDLLEVQLMPEFHNRPRGRPPFCIPIANIEHLLSLSFNALDISKIYGVSKDTIFRRLRANGLSVSDTYSQITDIHLHLKIQQILSQFPNTGYKRMKGFLLEAGIKITESRTRTAMRVADPAGVYYRTQHNHAIRRRVYFVTYFNQLWHLDTNMKLIRWNMVIRGCIDGKTRLVTYLDASADNTAISNLASFMTAVTQYGIPSRTRSDKGGENVLIARYMIEQRGLGRASHICGRSVHNQRIERFWRDVYYGFTGCIYNTLSALEEDGYLNIDNPKHICTIHKVFLPRINSSLNTFMNAWNNHPLRSERNYSPLQLMIIHAPPANYDLPLTEADLENASFVCNRLDDLRTLTQPQADTITQPEFRHQHFTENELGRLSQIDMMRESQFYGYDIFVDAVRCLDA